MSLLSMVVVAGVSSTTLLQQSSKRAAQRTTAMEIAQGELDRFQAIPYNPPNAPYGSSTYTESNYVLVTEAPGGTAAYQMDVAAQEQAALEAAEEIEAALEAAEEQLAVAKKAETAAQKQYDDQLKVCQDKQERCDKAWLEWQAKPNDTKKQAAYEQKKEELDVATAGLASKEQALSGASATVNSAEALVAYWENGGVDPAGGAGSGYEKPSTTPPAISGGPTMAAMITTVEPVENGHVVTVVMQFFNHNQDSSLRMQTLVNKHAGGQPRAGYKEWKNPKKK